MIFTETEIPRAFIIDIERREDHRGFFARSWCLKEFESHGLNPDIIQINVGYNVSKGTLRGMHFQLSPYQEVKLVRCTMGAVFDVIVDLRPDSSMHKKWIGVELTEENHLMLYIPEGCAHGYQTLVDNSEIYYQTSQFYAPEHAVGVRYNDPSFGIKWPLEVENISDADRSWPDYRE
jgi:dTDP-4-dehydrorhamnose 3,5-epimerase